MIGAMKHDAIPADKVGAVSLTSANWHRDPTMADLIREAERRLLRMDDWKEIEPEVHKAIARILSEPDP